MSRITTKHTKSQQRTDDQNYLSLVTRKPVFGVCDQLEAWDFAYIETTDIILSKQRIKKALIRLRECAGWSAPLLFAHGITGSHDAVHLLGALWVAKAPKHLHVYSEDWSGRMRKRGYPDWTTCLKSCRFSLESDFLASKWSPFQNLNIFTAAGVKFRVVVLKSLRVLRHSADDIFWSFGSVSSFAVVPYTIALKDPLGGVISGALTITAHEQTQ